jgi:3-oxoadipate enol-lactonase
MSRTFRNVLPLLSCIAFAYFACPTAAAQGSTIRINGEQLYYEVDGNGAPLVLIHGWSLNLRMWDAQVRELSRTYRVIRYDRRGFGRSTGHEDITWDAADLNALLDHLGIASAHILGMSQGARVALQFARNYPRRVTALILHGTPAPNGFPLAWSGEDRPRFDEWERIAREQGMDAFRRAWSAHPLMSVPTGRSKVVAELAMLLGAYRGGRFLDPAQPSGPITEITMDDLPGIKVPTLVVAGDAEVPFLQIVARSLAYYLPSARFASIQDGGHMVNIIAPKTYNAAVSDFLRSVSQPALHRQLPPAAQGAPRAFRSARSRSSASRAAATTRSSGM